MSIELAADPLPARVLTADEFDVLRSSRSLAHRPVVHFDHLRLRCTARLPLGGSSHSCTLCDTLLALAVVRMRLEIREVEPDRLFDLRAIVPDGQGHRAAVLSLALPHGVEPLVHRVVESVDETTAVDCRRHSKPLSVGRLAEPRVFPGVVALARDA